MIEKFSAHPEHLLKVDSIDHLIHRIPGGSFLLSPTSSSVALALALAYEHMQIKLVTRVFVET